MESASTVTSLLGRWRAGDQGALDDLIPIVYGEMRRLAQFHLGAERPEHTWRATELVHEAYLRLAGQDDKTYQNRTHFFAVCSRVMRQVLVDHAREHRALKRGGDAAVVNLDEALTVPVQPDLDVLRVDEALTRFERIDPEKLRIVEMRFFAGLNVEEIADVLRVSPITVKRKWAVAKAWLYHDLKKGGPGGAGTLATS